MIKRNPSAKRRFMYKAMQMLLLLSIIIVGFVISSHDYPAHDYLVFLHNLLRDNASIKQIPPLFALNGIMGPDVVPSGTIVSFMKNVCQWVQGRQGNEYNWPTLEVVLLVVNREQESLSHPVSSGLSPPTDIAAWTRGFCSLFTCVVLSSDHVIQNNWFHHIPVIFSSSIATGYFNIRNTEKDRAVLRVANWLLARFNNTPERQKPPEAS